jgi:hypothetical protein
VADPSFLGLLQLPIAAPIPCMDEMYRMLGREHAADLAREATKWKRADEVRRAERALVARPSTRSRLNPARIVVLLARIGRKEVSRTYQTST